MLLTKLILGFSGVIIAALTWGFVELYKAKKAEKKKREEIKQQQEEILRNREQCEHWYQQTFDDLILDNKDRK